VASGGTEATLPPSALGGLLNATVYYPVGVLQELTWGLTYSSAAAPLTETDVLSVVDTVAPTEPSDWVTNPGDTPVATGAALAVFTYTTAPAPAPPGPWGGSLPSAADDWQPEYGFFGLAAPVAGMQVEVRRETGAVVGGPLVAVAGAANPLLGEWSILGLPAVNLALAINTYPPTAALLTAEVGSENGVAIVTVKAIVPLVYPLFYYLTTSAIVSIHLGIVQRLG